MQLKLNKHLLKVTIPTHLLFLLSLFVIDYTLTNALGIAFFYVLFAGFGIAVGYHKYFSHRSFETYPIIEKMLAIFGLMSMAGSVLFWVCYHRGVHHRHADKPQDLHSPRRGYLKSFLLWHNDIQADTINVASGRDLLKKPFIMWVHHNQNKVYWGIIAFVALISWQVCLGILIPAIVLSHHQDNLINLFGHIRGVGYRNFDTDDDSVNEAVMGYLFWGQGWHNNHHANPSKLDYGEKWWEFDSAAKILVPLIRKR